MSGIYDVVIVGGGVSGCYAAWRLANEGQKHCLLLEGSDRIGGRLYSVLHPETPHVYAEAGGMRFKKCHHSVSKLVDHLSLETKIFPMGGPENLVYTRGKYYTQGDCGNPDIVPYGLEASERGFTADELLNSILERCIEADVEGCAQSLRNATYKGIPLWQVGWWNLLSQEMSTEAFHFINEVCGHSGYLRNWNAYSVGLQHYTAESEGAFYTLKDGYQALPLELHKRFLEAGGDCSLSTRVSGVYQANDQLYEVKSTDGRVFKTRAVILALPAFALGRLDRAGLPFQNPDFVKALESVRLDPACKIFLWYDQEWWTEMGLTSGGSITDLPIRRCYYFGTEESSEGRAGLLMASYNDDVASDYWDSYAHRPSFSNRDDFSSCMTPPDDLLSDLQRQLEKLHNRKLPAPHSSIFQDWNTEPYGGGWHHWNPNWKPWEVTELMRKPMSGVALHVCGEAFSEAQGWVVGALDNAEALLRQEFGLKAADWLN